MTMGNCCSKISLCLGIGEESRDSEESSISESRGHQGHPNRNLHSPRSRETLSTNRTNANAQEKCTDKTPLLSDRGKTYSPSDGQRGACGSPPRHHTVRSRSPSPKQQSKKSQNVTAEGTREKSDDIGHPAPSKRHLIAMELLDTETTYIRKLKTIIDVYKYPLERAAEDGDPILSSDDIETMFDGIDEILSAHTSIHQELSNVISNWSEDCCIGSIITKYQSTLTKAYPRYVNHSDKGKDLILSQQKSNPKFNDFIMHCVNNSMCQNQPFDALMNSPVARLASMSPLISDLQKNTPKDLRDHKELESAKGSLTRLLSLMKESTRLAESKSKMSDILYEVENCPPEIASSNRSFVARSNVTSINEGLCGAGDKLALYLLTDNIQVAKFKRSPENVPLKHIMMLPLEDIQFVFDINESDESVNMFAIQLVDKSSTMSDIQDPYRNRLSVFQVFDGPHHKQIFLKSLEKQLRVSHDKNDGEKVLWTMDHTEIQRLLKNGENDLHRGEDEADSSCETVSTEVDCSGKTVKIGGCYVDFPPDCFDETQTVHIIVEIDPKKWPPGKIAITPSIDVKATNLKKMVTITLTSWCAPDDDADSVVDVQRFRDETGEWKVVRTCKLESSRTITFQGRNFIPYIATSIPKTFVLSARIYISKKHFIVAIMLDQKAARARCRKIVKKNLGTKARKFVISEFSCWSDTKIESQLSCEFREGVTFNPKEPYDHNIKDILNTTAPSLHNLTIQSDSRATNITFRCQIFTNGNRVKDECFPYDVPLNSPPHSNKVTKQSVLTTHAVPAGRANPSFDKTVESAVAVGAIDDKSKVDEDIRLSTTGKSVHPPKTDPVSSARPEDAKGNRSTAIVLHAGAAANINVVTGDMTKRSVQGATMGTYNEGVMNSTNINSEDHVYPPS